MEDFELTEFMKETKAKLDRIERAVLGQKTVFNVSDFCRYVGISKSWAYKLTSQRAVPHYKPNDKSIYFSKEEIDKWLLQNHVKTNSQLKLEIKK